MSYSNGPKEIIGAIAVGLFMSAALGAGVIGYNLIQTEQRARESLIYSKSFAPRQENLQSSVPPLRQESIQKAIELYQIKIPKNVVTPTLDLSMTDRGLTVRRGALAPLKVFIGPDAFSSWPLLGSTIAHEVEVHCRQNFLAIHLMDLAGLDGTGNAEREAYEYELRHAERFGLAPYDRDLIRSTASYFYPQRGFSLSEIPSLKAFISKMSRIDTRRTVKPVDARSL